MSYLASKGVSIIAIENQFKGRKFGELILHHLKEQTLSQINDSLIGLNQNINPILKESTLGFLDTIINGFAKSKDFWRTDCSEALRLYTNATKSEARKHGLEVNDDYAFDIFNLIVLSLARKASQDLEFHSFIKSSIRTFWFF